MRLRFWIKQGFETVFMILLCSLVYGFFMFVQGNDGWIGLLVLLPLYLLLFGALLMIAMTTAIHKLAVPLAISFGSTRNEVLLGLQLYRVIPVCLIPALATILTALGGEQSALPVSAVFPLGVGAFLLTSAFGSILGVIYVKHGKIATLVVVISFLTAGFAGGFGAAFSKGFGLSPLSLSGAIPWLVLAAGLFLYAIAMIPEQRIVWKYNVKL